MAEDNHIRTGFPGPSANDDAHPSGISVGLDPIACRACKFVGTMLDMAIICDDDGKLIGPVVCGKCGSENLDYNPPPLPRASPQSLSSKGENNGG